MAEHLDNRVPIRAPTLESSDAPRDEVGGRIVGLAATVRACDIQLPWSLDGNHFVAGRGIVKDRDRPRAPRAYHAIPPLAGFRVSPQPSRCAPSPLGDPCPPGLPVVSIPRQPAASRLDMPCVAPEVRRRRVHPGRDQRIPDSRTPSTEEALRVGSTAHGMPAPGDGTLPSLSVDRRDSPTVIAPDRHCRVERPRAGPARRCRRPSSERESPPSAAASDSMVVAAPTEFGRRRMVWPFPLTIIRSNLDVWDQTKRTMAMTPTISE